MRRNISNSLFLILKALILWDEIDVILGKRGASGEESGISIQMTRNALLQNWNKPRAGRHPTYILGITVSNSIDTITRAVHLNFGLDVYLGNLRHILKFFNIMLS